jgi:FMN-dependent NADH-azoreductase
MTNILRIDSSARIEGSVTRELSASLAAELAGPDGVVSVRDVAATPPAVVDAAWVGANFTSPDARTDAQRAELANSDALVAELEAADRIVIGVPVYNFSVPASLKAWIDQIGRVHRTFRYTQDGPEGLLDGSKTAWLVVASGGTALDSEIDFATPYLRHVLGFIGITDVRVIDATRWGALKDEEQAAIRADARARAAA